MKKIILFSLVIISSCTNQDDSIEKYNKIHDAPETNKTIPVPETTYTAEEKDSINIEDALTRIQNLTRAKDRNNVSSIAQEADDFEEISQIVSNRGDILPSRAELLKKQLIQLQKEDFPILRKNYVKAAADRMWEEDVKVNGQNDWIAFTGGSFAAHRVIKSSEEALHDMLMKLRFKSVTFEWVRNASDGTTYSLNSKDDTDL